MNNYQFPETVPISEAAKDLIIKILNNDPTRRPTVDEILLHPWLSNNSQIPRFLPPSTLACPPTQAYIN